MHKIFKLLLLEHSEFIDVAVKEGLVTFDAIDKMSQEFESFSWEIEKQWPPSRIKEFIVQHHRDTYAKCGKRIREVELENRDDRIRGVSFANRKKHADKMKFLYDYATHSAKRGIDAKSLVYDVRLMVEPTDMILIERSGFEFFLKLYYV